MAITQKNPHNNLVMRVFDFQWLEASIQPEITGRLTKGSKELKPLPGHLHKKNSAR